MAATTSSKAKPASKAGNSGKQRPRSQMHRRSRTGCYTCRLRRKKCDEGDPVCSACKNLGLSCEYKRPMWWGNADTRRQRKEDIKNIIKQKKLSEKSHAMPTAAANINLNSPPSLSHSVPTSTYTDPSERNRSSSIDSHFSNGFSFNTPPNPAGIHSVYGAHLAPNFLIGGAGAGPGVGYSPYEIDVKTERQMFVDDVPTLKESHVSTFSTFHTPPPPGTVLPCGVGVDDGSSWAEHIHRERCESLSEETFDVNFFDFAHQHHQDPPSPSSSSVPAPSSGFEFRVELEDNDQRLLEHFIQAVLPTIFPILESNQHGCVGTGLILPALQNNQVYLHCCLSVAAQHLKGQVNAISAELDQDIMRHRYATIWSLCEALKRDENHQDILEATLALIFFQCVAGRCDDGLLDIPWHQHFQAAVNLVHKLALPQMVLDPAQQVLQAPFNMTLTAWIDILGASMTGVSPTFAHAYREKHVASANPSLGLRELMGCDDRVMYLISEIACLESLKKTGMDDFTLCQHVSLLGEQMTLTEMESSSYPGSSADVGGAVKPALSAEGILSPKQLSRNITTAFRLAARIYLCSLVPGFSPNQHSPITLVARLVDVLGTVPSGPHGYDRSLVWVYLMGGSISLPDSEFRPFFEDRVGQLGEQAQCGSFGRMLNVLRATWAHNDPLQEARATPGSDGSEVNSTLMHWRDVMHMKGWDFLMI
ncbi:hypothetical protein GMORB2_6154 [Geosmithia morbida]|uniref:Zn(2)-C6 fungal-type domain-containing protein n=1 Tax=Geosmithia morbida TaxID=1094350 RepID=A0A9P5D143_9HYPO|nr:uncharacterized protein GMORB2_6154 [Geosmithia morbida]KAF4123453.1 hypothetical protein GMORB2_6154 [Geosmithia morbida]